ncbi:hypothetical protein JOF34_001435 [Microbacterium amylolyticum]|uniref:Uncharacterized protein n=1 Tax=Microbacterium amylolyticum TaxID=936337 RepID=A0ABS4ZHV5_9MICO|nr:hypothetical protein [Microbacterium amylolyticum]MBP2436849.1 hypothetical protein [Microbacterium amylolyticum]
MQHRGGFRNEIPAQRHQPVTHTPQRHTPAALRALGVGVHTVLIKGRDPHFGDVDDIAVGGNGRVRCKVLRGAGGEGNDALLCSGEIYRMTSSPLRDLVERGGDIQG